MSETWDNYPADAFKMKCDQLQIARKALIELESHVGENNDSWVSTKASQAIYDIDKIEEVKCKTHDSLGGHNGKES